MSLRSRIFIISGIYALFGIYFVKKLIFLYNFSEVGINLLPINFFEIFLFVIAFLVILISFITAYVLAKRSKKEISKKVKIHILVPVIISFILILFLLTNNYHFISSASLILYGLILINLSRIDLGKYLFLGFIEIILGVIAFLIGSNDLIFLGIGFGVIPIIFGLFNYKKTELKNQDWV